MFLFFVYLSLYLNFIILRCLFGPLPHIPVEGRRERHPKTYLGPSGCLSNEGICDREMGGEMMLSSSCTVEKGGKGDMMMVMRYKQI